MFIAEPEIETLITVPRLRCRNHANFIDERSAQSCEVVRLT
jgi:hypothetical protein